jgi:hypothetical protein
MSEVDSETNRFTVIEQETRERITTDIAWYVKNSNRNRIIHLGLSGIVIVCGVLAPLTVVSASVAAGASRPDLSILSLSAHDQAVLSLVLTIMFGLRTDAEISDAVCWNEQGEMPSVWRSQVHHLFLRLS